MPIHNWSRVSDGMFHWFHQRGSSLLPNGSTMAGCPNVFTPSAKFTPIKSNLTCWRSKFDQPKMAGAMDAQRPGLASPFWRPRPKRASLGRRRRNRIFQERPHRRS